MWVLIWGLCHLWVWPPYPQKKEGQHWRPEECLKIGAHFLWSVSKATGNSFTNPKWECEWRSSRCCTLSTLWGFTLFLQKDGCSPHKAVCTVSAVCLCIHMCLFSTRCAVPFLCDQPICGLWHGNPCNFLYSTLYRLPTPWAYDPLLSPFSRSLSSISPSPLPLLPSGRSLRLSRCLPNIPTASSSLFPCSCTCMSLFALIWVENALQLLVRLQCETEGLKWCSPGGKSGALDAAEC